MTQYYTDFSEYTTGAQPSDWTARINNSFSWTVQDDTAAEGGKILRGGEGASSDRNGLSWDVVDGDTSRADVQTFMRIRFPDAASVGDIMSMARGSGVDSNSANLYRFGVRPEGVAGEFIQISRYLSGDFLSLKFDPDYIVGTTLQNVVTQVRGTALKMKIWPAGDPEPSTWLVEVDNTEISGAGWVGLFRFDVGVADIHAFGVGTGTDDAPRAPLTVVDNPPSLTDPTASTDGTLGYTGSVATDSGSGTLYHVVTNSSTAPSGAQVKAGNDATGAAATSSGSQAISTTGTKTVSGTGLTEDITYYIHFHHEDADGGSPVVSSGGITHVAATGDQYSTDFSEYTTGSQPTGWTQRADLVGSFTVEDNVNALGGKALSVTPASDGDNMALTWDLVPDTTGDIQVLMKVTPFSSDTGYHAYATTRVQPDSARYVMGFNYDDARINRISATGSTSVLNGTGVSAGVTPGASYWILAESVGSAQRVKLWDDGTLEPELWTHSASDSNFTTGFAGISRTYGNAFQVEYFSVGLEGAAAPAPGPTTNPPTLTSPTGSTDGTLGYTGSVSTNSDNGTLYHVVTNSATKPTSTQIKAGNDATGVAATGSGSQTITSSGVKTVSGAGLTEDITYYIHFYHENVDGGSSVVSSGGLTHLSGGTNPTTTFEDSLDDNPAWTTVADEQTFLQAIQTQSSTMSYESLGNSVEGKPINLVRVGYPSVPTDLDLKNKSVTIMLGLQHGNEPSGRETLLQYLRDLAFSTDPAVQQYLTDHPVLIIPTMNPDRLDTDRQNANNVDLNREWVSYGQPEVAAAGKAFRDYDPVISLDLHELNSTITNQFELLQSTNLSVDSDLRTLATGLKTNLQDSATAAGFVAVDFSGSDGANILRNSGGLGNTLSVLIEAASNTDVLTRKNSVVGQTAMLDSARQWHTTNETTTDSTVATAKSRAITDGENRNSFPDPSLGTIPLGYTLTAAEASSASVALDRRNLVVQPIVDSTDFYVSMAQEGKRMLPFTVNSGLQVVSGDPVTTEPQLEAVAAPTTAPTINSTSVTQTTVEVAYTGVGDATSYQYRLDGGTPVDVGTTNPFTISSLSSGISYNLEVAAVNSGGVGPYSTVSTFTTETATGPTTAPTINSTTTTQTSAEVDYTGVSGATSYQYKINGGTPVNVGTNKPFTITDLSPGVNYNLELAGVNSDGVGPYSSVYVLTTESPTGPTSAPTITGVSPLDISAEVSYSGVSGATSYQYKLNGNAPVDVGTVNPFTISGLSASGSYSVELAGVNTDGVGPYSSPVSFNTTSSSTGAPANAPTVNSIDTTNTDAIVNYSGVSGATSYQYTLDSGAPVNIGTTDPFTISGLSPESTHNIRVAGVNTDGVGPYSATASFLMKSSSAGNFVNASITLGSASSDVRLVVSKSSDLSNPIESTSVSTGTFNIAKINMQGLDTGTKYYYGVKVGGVLQAETGTFSTFGTNSESFKFAFASCEKNHSNSPMFTEIKNLNPKVFVHMGDIHYDDIGTNDESLFQAAYDKVFAQSNVKDLFRNVPMAYVWDDRDYGPNNSNGTSASKPAAFAAYKNRIPHYELGGSEGIYQSFTIGKIRFILCDSRYFRDLESGKIFGSTQEAWIQAELEAAQAAGQFACLGFSVPWVSSSGTDTFAGYTSNRVAIANMIKAAGMGQRSFVISGDMHAQAVYSPVHQTVGDYATNGGCNMPVFHAGPLDNVGSSKGGPYHLGPFEGGNRFNTIDVLDNGDGTVALTCTGYEYSNSTLNTVFTYDITLPHTN